MITPSGRNRRISRQVRERFRRWRLDSVSRGRKSHRTGIPIRFPRAYSSDHETQKKHTTSCQPEKLARLVISFPKKIRYTSIGWSDD
jgi:hypothetical protein